MGVIFSKSESRTLIDGIKTNLNNAREVTQDLQIGCTHLVQAVDGHTLSGAAYQAGANLFSELILPTVERCADAISEMEEDLQTYIGADSAIQAASQDTLDEAKLEQKIRECEAHQNAMKATANALNSQAFEMMAMTNPVAAIVSIANQLFDLQGKLNSQAESLEQDIEKLKKDLRLFQDFSSGTQGLFSNSFDELKTIIQIIIAISVDDVGNYAMSFNNKKEFKKFKEFANSGGLPKELAQSVLSQGTISKATKEVGQYYKIKGIKQGSRSSSHTSLSRIAKAARETEEFGDDIVNISKKIGTNGIWKKLGAAGTVFSIGSDYDDQMSQYNDIGRAIKNTAAHAAIGVGGSTAGAYIGGIIGSAIPIPVLGTVAGAAIGAGIGWAGSKAYDWVESGEAAKFVDNTGKQVSKTIDKVKDEAAKAFSGFGKSLGSVFG